MLLAAAALLIFVGYTYAGYPIAVAVLAKIFPAAINRDESLRPTVSVICSVYNGAPFIAAKIKSIVDSSYPSDKLELLFYDDGSTDDSVERLEETLAGLAGACKSSAVVRGDGRLGKPTALAVLSARASGEVLLLTDIRQPLSQDAIGELVAALADPTVSCAGGLLVLEGTSGASAYWKYEGWIRRSESAFRSVIGVSGSLYAIAKRDFPPIPADTILDDLYVPMQARLAGGRVVLVDRARAFDAAADDSREFGRKARTLAGNYQLFARMPTLLSPLHNPSWFETVSHKLARLLCPWALIALACVSLAGARAEPMLLGLLAVQLAAYTAAVFGRLAGPVGKLARTFVVLNAAAVVGLWRFLGGRQQITW